MIIHIPHSSTVLKDLYVDSSLSEDVNLVTDWYTNELFFCHGSRKLVFPYSRLVCDVERFINDPLNELGYGLHTIYTQSGIQYRGYDKYDETLAIYNEWHQNLAECVKFQSHYIERTVIVDAHSFSETQLSGKFYNSIPDICIGSNPDTPKVLVDLTVDHFKQLGYDVLENIPYAGAITSSGAESIMIEVNKKLYLGDNNFKHPWGYVTLRNDIETVLNHINDYEFDGK